MLEKEILRRALSRLCRKTSLARKICAAAGDRGICRQLKLRSKETDARCSPLRAQIFRASEVLRQSRDKARLKYLFLQHGWTAESFLPNWSARSDLHSIPPSRKRFRDIHAIISVSTGRNRAALLRWRASPTRPHYAAQLRKWRTRRRSRRWPRRLTVQQNILLINVSEARVNQVVNELN